MKILLVNDDGIRCVGLISLAKTLVQMGHDLVIVAPNNEMSCTSHSITFNSHINYEEVFLINNARSFSISGTPVDCVKFGVGYIMQEVLNEFPDLVISGINTTCNIGTDVIYSGTVGAAIEAGIMGLKGLALSYNCDDGKYDYVCNFIKENLVKIYSVMNNNTVISINFPYYKTIKGVRYCSTGNRRFNDTYQYVDKKGFYITGYPVSIPNESNSDVIAFDEGYITIAPIKVNFTDNELLQKLKEKQIR